MIPPWVAPPDDVMGGTVPIERWLFHSESLAVALAYAHAFPAGVMLHIRVAIRRTEEMDEETWWARNDLAFGHFPFRRRSKGALDHGSLRFGVLLPDGSKATAVDSRREKTGEQPPPEPGGAILHENGGGTVVAGSRLIHARRHLWLWPLPPPEPLAFAVEWLAMDVPLTFTEIDGAPIVAAAGRARPYWP
ncbi:hypothetical protein GCM10017673_32550 [Streptosporangium violaceochromogenes]|nr:hypothetical protein GCM10017673_32550 [Streptosporangium violaceochromogenes]